MNLDWYQTFITLAQELNYRKASEKLFLSQPAIHQQIKKLEQHLHVKLFDTIGRAIQLNENGRLFLPLAEALIQHYTESLAIFSKKQQRYPIQLNILVCSYVATYLIPNFLPLLFRKEPHMEISISVNDGNVISSIEDNHFDIAILKEKPNGYRIFCEQVCEGQVKLVVPNIKDNMKFDDEMYYLNHYRILANTHASYWNGISEQILSIVPQADIISIEDVNVSEKLISLNQGVSYLPTYILNEHHNDLLKVIEPKLIFPPNSFTYFAYIKNSPEIEKFKRMFKEFVLNEQNNFAQI